MRQISDSSAVRQQGRRSVWAVRVLLAIVGFLVGAGHAQAEPELSLSWSTREPLSACPDLTWAMARVARELGRTPSAEVQQGVRAIVTIEKRAASFRLSVATEIADAHGERVIEGENCRELSEAAILIVALGVSEADEARARDAEKAASPKVVESAPAAKDEAHARPKPAAQRLGFLLRPELVVELGLLRAQPTLGPGLALGLEWGVFRVEAAGTWLVFGTLRKDGQEIGLRLGAARRGARREHRDRWGQSHVLGRQHPDRPPARGSRGAPFAPAGCGPRGKLGAPSPAAPGSGRQSAAVPRFASRATAYTFGPSGFLLAERRAILGAQKYPSGALGRPGSER
jgi:hypothetical protein